MIPLVLALLAVAPARNARTAPEAKPSARAVASARAAIADLVTRRPRVMAFGELHQTAATARVPSSLKHFTEELFDAIAPRASDIVVETWVTQGKCGKTEAAVVKNVQKTTQRPAETEDEVVALLERAKAAGVKPHMLDLSCKEYDSIYLGKGGVNYENLLRLTSEKLEAAIREVLVAPGARDDNRAIVVYGGALHNDLFPRAELAPFTFGENISNTVGGRYLEIDLYVPEYIDKQKSLRAEPWYAPYQRAARPGKATLIERSLESYVIVFPRAQKATKVRPKAQRR